MLINIIACLISDNLAFGKQTDQSSVNFEGVSSRAVDGISNTDYYANSCTHTDKELNPWWRVDLGQVEPVSEIYLVNQENQWFYRQNNFEIRVGMLDNFRIVILYYDVNIFQVITSHNVGRVKLFSHFDCWVPLKFIYAYICRETLSRNFGQIHHDSESLLSSCPTCGRYDKIMEAGL